MTINEFKELPPEKRYEYVLKEGKYIAGRSEGKFTINLYAINGFYCEVFYDLGLSALGELVPFKNIEGLEPYMDLIKVPGPGDNKGLRNI